jgi:hypothetical protein
MVKDSSLYRHLSGDSDEAEAITEEEAMKFLTYLTNGEAARDKQNGT